MILKRIVIGVAVWAAAAVVGVGRNYAFRHIGTSDGLSDNYITCVCPDSRGFVWIGTASGLDRYDGYGFRTFYARPGDPAALPDSFIEDIFEDRDGRLWIRTISGYVLYDIASASFNSDMTSLMAASGVPAAPDLVYLDGGGDFWIFVPDSGVYVLPRDRSASPLNPAPDSSSASSDPAGHAVFSASAASSRQQGGGPALRPDLYLLRRMPGRRPRRDRPGRPLPCRPLHP